MDYEIWIHLMASLLSIRQFAILHTSVLYRMFSNTDFLFTYIQQIMTLRSFIWRM